MFTNTMSASKRSRSTDLLSEDIMSNDDWMDFLIDPYLCTLDEETQDVVYIPPPPPSPRPSQLLLPQSQPPSSPTSPLDLAMPPPPPSFPPPRSSGLFDFQFESDDITDKQIVQMCNRDRVVNKYEFIQFVVRKQARTTLQDGRSILTLVKESGPYELIIAELIRVIQPKWREDEDLVYVMHSILHPRDLPKLKMDAPNLSAYERAQRLGKYRQSKRELAKTMPTGLVYYALFRMEIGSPFKDIVHFFMDRNLSQTHLLGAPIIRIAIEQCRYDLLVIELFRKVRFLPCIDEEVVNIVSLVSSRNPYICRQVQSKLLRKKMLSSGNVVSY